MVFVDAQSLKHSCLHPQASLVPGWKAALDISTMVARVQIQGSRVSLSKSLSLFFATFATFFKKRDNFGASCFELRSELGVYEPHNRPFQVPDLI